MDPVTFLISLNKISLVAFLITFSFLGYEIYVFTKTNRKKIKPNVPKFQETVTINPIQGETLNNNEDQPVKRSSNLIIILLIILLIVFGGVTVFGFTNLTKTKLKSQTPTPSITENIINSKGIKILNTDFDPIPDYEVSEATPGGKVIIGVETITDTDIDRARIKINKQEWDMDDITTKFNKKSNVFYIEYIIATGEPNLKIEAQLHSKTDGWLGD